MDENKPDINLIDLYEKILERSDKEINRIHGMYKLAVYLVTISATIIIALGAFIFFSNMNDIKDDASKRIDKLIESSNKEVDNLKLNVNNEIKRTMDSTKNSILDNMVEVKKEVNKKIETEFDKENISALVHQTAKDRIDKMADQLIEKQIDELVKQNITPQLDDVLNKLGYSDQKIQMIEFYLAKVASNNDDRISFEKLIEISENNGHIFKNEANQVVQSLILRYSQPNVPRLHVILRALGSDFDWSFSKAVASYFNYSKDERMVIIDNIWELKRFTIEEKIKIALFAVKKDESLLVVSKAATYLINEFKLPFKNLEIEKIIDAVSKKGYN